MKKMILILGLCLIIKVQSQAQHFTASFGIEHTWGVPTSVSHVVYDRYYGYDWVHASRVYNHGDLFFDVVLQRGDVFVEVRLDNYGHVMHRRVRDYYPLVNHVCSNHCGYHSNYYSSHFNGCHSHHHHGHNHVVYSRPTVVHHHNTHVVHHSAPTKHVVHKSKTVVVHDNHSSRNRMQAKSSSPTRRGRYNQSSSRSNERHSSSRGSSRGNSRSSGKSQRSSGSQYARRGN